VFEPLNPVNISHETRNIKISRLVDVLGVLTCNAGTLVDHSYGSTITLEPFLPESTLYGKTVLWEVVLR
jgi:hypothetical protein